MIVTTWNYGAFNKSGAGYGVRILKEDRDKYFDKSWESVFVQFEDYCIEIILRDTFWSTCSELRSKKIGEFLLSMNMVSGARENHIN